MEIQKIKWEDISANPMSLEAVRVLYRSENAYRIFENRHPPSAHFVETIGMPCTVFIIEGSCSYTTDGLAVTLMAGDVAVIQKGSYVRDVGEFGVHFVRAVKLPTPSPSSTR